MKRINKHLLLFFFLLISLASLNGQSAKYNFKGFIKSDVFWDSRQVASARQGHFLLYPLNASLDVEGKDINDASCFHILPIQSRLIFTAKEKEALGAKASAKIEGEFFGNSEIGINSFRLRHAFVKLEWLRSSLLVGQYWHPMFIESNYPSTISFNTGVPFIPFSRNPQIRYSYKAGNLELSLSVFSQLDFKSSGPDGPNVNYAVHARYPASNFRLIYHTTTKSGLKFNTGFSLNSKSLRPSLITETGYKDEVSIRTYATTAFLGIKNSKIGVKLQGTYGEDLYNLTMIGGYGIYKITDEIKQLKEYSANRTLAFWADAHNFHPNHQLGLLMGYTKNIDIQNQFIDKLYGRGADISYVYRISPRYAYRKGNYKIATEFEYTAAAYMTEDEFGVMKDPKTYANLRILVAAFYYFNTALN